MVESQRVRRPGRSSTASVTSVGAERSKQTLIIIATTTFSRSFVMHQ